jgi:hypothetical protein
MAIDPREREYIRVSRSGLNVPAGEEKNIGAMPCWQLRKVTASVRGTYADANDTIDPLCLEIFFSPDGQNWDDDSLASIFLPRGQTLDRQISVSFNPPEVGYIAAKLRNPDALTVSDCSVWMGGRRWADNQTMQAAQV